VSEPCGRRGAEKKTCKKMKTGIFRLGFVGVFANEAEAKAAPA